MLSYDIIILLVIAGLGAGIVTGLAGASAATIITPLLVTFSPIAAYTAIAISLITDVFASFFSFLTYKKSGNINIKDGAILTVTACIGAFVGSYFSSYINNDFLGGIGGLMTFLLGLNFLRKGIRQRKITKEGAEILNVDSKKKEKSANPIISSIFLGLALGIVCGIVGAGGGLMILYVLTSVLKYDTKTAIGTSVLIMTFTALTGGVSHLMHIGDLNFQLLFTAMGITSFFAVIGAKGAATFANRTNEDILITIVGSIFTVLSIVMFIQKI